MPGPRFGRRRLLQVGGAGVLGALALSAARADSDSDPVWQSEPGGAVRTSPTVVDGTVYVGGPDGRVYALDPPVEESSVGSRVRLGTLGHRGDWRHANGSLDVAGANNPDGSGNPGDNQDDDGADDQGDDGFGPGPGPGTALAGLGGAYLLRRLWGGDDRTE